MDFLYFTVSQDPGISFYREYVSKTPFTEGIVLSKNFHLLSLSSSIEKKNLVLLNPYLQSYFFNVSFQAIDIEEEMKPQKVMK